MSHYTPLRTEKYYLEKIKAEDRAVRRYQAGQSMKQLCAGLSMLSVFGVVAWVVLMNPTFVPDCIDQLRSSGILSF